MPDREPGAASLNAAQTNSSRKKVNLDSNDKRRGEIVKGSPSVSAKSAKMKKHKSRPHIKRLASSTASHPKLIYSVDDDVSDAMNDEEILKRDREYLEWYTDTLRDIYTKKPKVVNKNDGEGDQGSKGEREVIEEEITNNIASAEENLKLLNDIENEEHGDHATEVEENDEVEGDTDDAKSQTSTSSSQTIESLNLRERQDAINSTHPFGIKIWKPSLYKKKRSVATRAEEDIHDFDRPSYTISLGVHFFNLIWCLSFGLLLYILCMAGAAFVFLSSGFAISKHLRSYVRFLMRLGKYWLNPFGKFILLNKDENYLEEDEMEGRTLSEYYRWRSEDESRLFFAPPRRNTNTHESRPLIKDHKGRNLRDVYTGINESEYGTNSAINDDTTAEHGDTDMKKRFFGRGRWSWGRIVFYFYFYAVLQPINIVILSLCYLMVFTIPMSNLSLILCDHIRRHPLALRFLLEKEYRKKNNRKQDDDYMVILCTYRSCGLHYYKYTIDGTNIFFINLLFAVIFVIFDYYFLKERLQWELWLTESSFLFCACLFSVIPLAYFIGQAVASISAQSSMGVGAVINAFFSTIVEIFLYCVALNQSKGKLVEGSMIGSVLGGVLLLPGLSMCGGALKRKTQRYNPHSAGVSSTMLLYAMVIMFAPSFFYEIYGTYELECRQCKEGEITQQALNECAICRFIQPSFTLSPLYHKVIKPFSLLVALALFLAYTCGLLFTLRTHASLIWATASHEQNALGKKEDWFRSPSIISLDNIPSLKTGKASAKNNALASYSNDRVTSGTIQNANLAQGSVSLRNRNIKTQPSNKNQSKGPSTDPSQVLKSLSLQKDAEGADEDTGGHDAPNWSRTKSAVILLGATFLYAIIAEILVDNVDSVLSSFHINPKFLGLTVFALVPNTTEFVNAISFAVSGNVALSMEIGSAYALQVVLIQIPSLVVYSIYKGFNDVDKIFSLVFPRWDIISTLISIYLFTYIYAEGKSNYFKGVILILIYSVVMVGFWFNNNLSDLLETNILKLKFS